MSEISSVTKHFEKLLILISGSSEQSKPELKKIILLLLYLLHRVWREVAPPIYQKRYGVGWLGKHRREYFRDRHFQGATFSSPHIAILVL